MFLKNPQQFKTQNKGSDYAFIMASNIELYITWKNEMNNHIVACVS
jgi:hypothetical protein